ncbi:hypothetical protein NQ318_022492 [Aromia moschata]|uniref:Transposase n=1 Tax=Aromia moschata TaxID=1265417 RepID=A0AAV8Z7S9_9CUCU|nr:hypothetical protein NQ318_022492 [Aromia moschata]
MYWKLVVSKPRASSTTVPITIPFAVVLTPEASLTAVLVKEPVTGMEWKKDPKRLRDGDVLQDGHQRAESDDGSVVLHHVDERELSSVEESARNIMLKRPKSASHLLVCDISCNTDIIVSKKASELPVIPKSPRNWDEAMLSAAAVVKPAITGIILYLPLQPPWSDSYPFKIFKWNEGCGDKTRKKRVCEIFNIKYPDRRISQSTVSRIENKFREFGNVTDIPQSGRKRILDDEQEFDILLDIQDNPHKPIRQVAADNDVSKTSILRLLKYEKYRPYKIRLVQELNDDDPDRRLEFCEIMTNRC